MLTGGHRSSSRLEDFDDEAAAAAEYKEMIEDKEHIQQEFDHMFSKQQIRQMTSEEMAFNWFSGHDTDDDKMLDGLELYKAISHSRGHKSGSHDHSQQHQSQLAVPPGVPPPQQTTSNGQIDDTQDALGTEDRFAIGFVDQLLTQFDADDDGRLDYAEFVKSFEEARDKLGIQKL